MRTTVTLDPDVAARLKELARERKISFKEALNRTLRAGLAAPGSAGRPPRMKTYSMGLRPGIDLDKALQLAGDLEDAEVIRKLERHK